MPTYDYACAACGHRFEEFQSMSAEPLVRCPECKKKKLERLIGAGAGVIFKGSGFYQTDYRGSSYSSDAKKDEAPKPEAPTGGGCSAKCGTGDAPAGCKMAKKKA
ncbi:MAG: zinc ribbon domain-containing protein [Planctomycetes bacterium]|jgi:putative FmdB family regulatory protein|nr:zinc ribbon domain-containing protein [Planctomycetota bacterium]